MESMLSARGNKLLIINKFTFRRSKETQLGVSYRCTRRGCPASIRVDKSEKILLKSNGEHNHTPIENLEIKKLQNKLKRKATESIREQPSNIIREVLREEQALNITPRDIQNIKKSIYRSRRSILLPFPELENANSREINNHNERQSEVPTKMNKEAIEIKVEPIDYFDIKQYKNLEIEPVEIMEIASIETIKTETEDIDMEPLDLRIHNKTYTGEDIAKYPRDLKTESVEVIKIEPNKNVTAEQMDVKNDAVEYAKRYSNWVKINPIEDMETDTTEDIKIEPTDIKSEATENLETRTTEDNNMTEPKDIAIKPIENVDTYTTENIIIDPTDIKIVPVNNLKTYMIRDITILPVDVRFEPTENFITYTTENIIIEPTTIEPINDLETYMTEDLTIESTAITTEPVEEYILYIITEPDLTPNNENEQHY